MYYQTTVCVAEMFGAICVMMLAVTPAHRTNPHPHPHLTLFRTLSLVLTLALALALTLTLALY